MANRNFPCNKLFQMHVMPVQLDCNIVIGSTGAVSSISGPGIANVVRLAVGTYRIQLQDNYQSLLQMHSCLTSPVTGSAINDGSFVSSTVYQIVTVGTTDFHAAGLPAAITPAAGAIFVAANVGGSGSGTVKALGVSGIEAVELIGISSTMIAPVPSAPLLGGYVIIQCLGSTNSSTTTQIPKDPASGSILGITMYLSNSSVQ